MRYRYLGSITGLLVGASVAVAQPWSSPKPVAQAPTAPPASAKPPAMVAQTPAASLQGAPTQGTLPPPVWSNTQLPTVDCCTDCNNPCNLTPLQRTSHCEDRLWFSANYLLYWVKDSPMGAIVTTGVEGDPPGAIDEADTIVLVGGRFGYKPFSGARLTIGYTIDDFGKTAIEGSFFAMGGRESVFQLASDAAGFPAISRPFMSTTPPEPDLFPGEDVHSVSRPELFTGSVRVGLDMDLLGAELNLSCSLVDVGPLCVDAIGGFRYLYMCETLDIRDSTVSIGGDLFLNGVPLAVFNPGTGTLDSTGFGLATHDRSRTVNHFYGGQIGLRGEYACGCAYVSGKLKCAIGCTNQMVHIEGDTTATLLDGTQAQVQGGVLALATNIGRREQTEFTVVPEAEVNLGVYLNEHCRIFVGYHFLYWSSVARPGDQFDHNINPSFLPSADPTAFGRGSNPANPRAFIEKNDFWLHGITTGFEYHY